MSCLSEQCRQLDELLAESSIYEDQNKDDLRDKLFERARASDQLAVAEGEWLEIQEQLQGFDT